MKQYPKVRRVSHADAKEVFERGEIVVLEKLDGNNFRFALADESELQFGSRQTKLGTDPDGIGGQFDDVTDYLAAQVDVDALADLEQECGRIVCFGENMIEHTLDYEWASVPQFLGFDVWLAGEDRFATWDRTREIFETLGVPTVPEIERVPADAIPLEREGDTVVVEYEIPPSKYRDGIAEGVIFRNDEVGARAKMVSETFRERHESTDDEPESDADRLVGRYCTPARIRKAAHRLLDEGTYDCLEMRMMEDLPMAVVDDIWAEEHAEIVRTDWTVDMEEMRTQVSRRCVPVLKEMVYDG